MKKTVLSVVLFFMSLPSWSALTVVELYGHLNLWSPNSFGLTPASEITLSVTYDEAWLVDPQWSNEPGYPAPYYPYVNSFDYYPYGARYTLSIGNLTFTERNDEGWGYRQYDMRFDEGKNLIGLSTHWYNNEVEGGFSDNLVLTMYPTNSSSPMTINFSTTPPSSIPVPAAAWLMGSSLLGVAGLSRRKK